MIEVGNSSVHGRGVFATQDIAEGQLFHSGDILTIEGAEAKHLEKMGLQHYVFYLRDWEEDKSVNVHGLVMSPMSFVNHSRDSNATFSPSEDCLKMHFTARRDIAAGEEITVDYGDFAEQIGIS